MGRFIQADTIVPGAEDSKIYDRYTYVNNNPMRYTDPSGYCIAANGSVIADYPFGTSGLCSPTTTTGIYAAGLDTVNNSFYISDDELTQSNIGVPHKDYENMVPLGPYRDAIVEYVDNAYLFGLPSYGDGGLKQKEVLAHQIKELMQKIVDEDPNARFFLTGHSAGADTVARAVSLFISENSASYAHCIIGVVLLDSSIIGDNDAGTYWDHPGSYMDELGVKAFSESRIPVLIMESGGYGVGDSFGMPNGMDLKPENYFAEFSHYQLAIANNPETGPYKAYLDFVRKLGVIE